MTVDSNEGNSRIVRYFPQRENRGREPQIRAVMLEPGDGKSYEADHS